MIVSSYTSIVQNNPSKLLGVPDFYYRWRTCDTNLNSNTPANQYQRQKLIQNSVRVYSSLYTMNLGSLTAYQRPIPETHGVCWNQMSDRVLPSVQKATIPTGFYTSANRRNTSVTSSRPGCQTPGGIGCDIKHNSYDRYLNRLKGKGPLRRGIIPPTFGTPFIPFNPAYPVYGGKTIKTNIVTGCNCPDVYIAPSNRANLTEEVKIVEDDTKKQDIQIYNNPLYQEYPVVELSFKVGDSVYAIKTGTDFYAKATIISVNDTIYVVEFEDGYTEIKNLDELKIYFPCNCDNVDSDTYSYQTGIFSIGSSANSVTCQFPII
jgi:hypothetical protein